MELRFAVVEDRLPDAQRLEGLLRLAFGNGYILVLSLIHICIPFCRRKRKAAERRSFIGGVVDGDDVVEAQLFGRAEGSAGGLETAAGHLVDLCVGGGDAQLVEGGGHPDAVVKVYHRVKMCIRDSMELTDALAEGLLRTVMKNARILHTDPANDEARAEVMWAGSLSHNGLTGCGIASGDFMSHKMEHEMGGMFDVTHGAGLAALWPSWARYVYKDCLPRFVRFARNVMGVTTDGTDEEMCIRDSYEGIRIGKENSIDFLLAVGGGSVIDTAKAIACLLYTSSRRGSSGLGMR